jgi:hypothetical protein
LLHPDWSRALPQPLLIPDVMILATLADARELMRHLPEDRRSRSTWRQVAADIEAAAAGGDIEGAAIGLRMVLMLEGHRLSVGVLRASLALKSQAGALSNSQPPTYLSTISRHEDQRRSREGPV